MSYLMLDSASFTPPNPEAVETMNAVLTASQANPLGRHGPGKDAARLLEAARRSVARALDAKPQDVIFTSGGTESANLGIKGLALGRLRLLQATQASGQAVPRVVVSAIEHPSVVESARWLNRWFGVEVVTLPVDSCGRISPSTLERCLSHVCPTLLVAICAASSEIGTIQPVSEIAQVCHAHGVPLYVDAVQAAGFISVLFRTWGVDALGVSGHKVGSPTSVGALLVDDHTPIEPIISGGGQERGLRSGTQDVATAVGFAVALCQTVDDLSGLLPGELATSRDQLSRGICQAVPTAQLTGHPQHRLPGHASFVFPGIVGESLLVDLDARGIACSAGSACDVLRAEPPQALLAMGYEPSVAQSAVRFTFRHPLTASEVEHVVRSVQESVTGLTGSDC